MKEDERVGVYVSCNSHLQAQQEVSKSSSGIAEFLPRPNDIPTDENFYFPMDVEDILTGRIITYALIRGPARALLTRKSCQLDVSFSHPFLLQTAEPHCFLSLVHLRNSRHFQQYDVCQLIAKFGYTSSLLHSCLRYCHCSAVTHVF